MFKLKVPQAEVGQIFFAVIFVMAVCEMLYLAYIDLAMENTFLGVNAGLWLVIVLSPIVAATVTAGALDLGNEFDRVASCFTLLTLSMVTGWATRFFWFALQDPNSIYDFIWPILLMGVAILIATNILERARHAA